MASTAAVDQLSKTLIGFASNGEFPDEKVSASAVGNEALPLAIEALGEAKLSLEVCPKILYFVLTTTPLFCLLTMYHTDRSSSNQ